MKCQESPWKLVLQLVRGEMLETECGFMWNLWNEEDDTAQRTADAHSVTGRSRQALKRSKFLEHVSDLVQRTDSAKFYLIHRSLKGSGGFLLSSRKKWPLAAGRLWLALKALSRVHQSLTCPEWVVTEGAFKHQSDLETWWLVMKGFKF